MYTQMYVFVVVFLIVVIISLFAYFFYITREQYTEYQFLNKYIGDVGISTQAYNNLILPENLYLDELTACFFISALNAVKTRFTINPIGLPMKITDKTFLRDLTVAIGQYTINVFNTQLPPNQIQFEVLETVIKEVMYWYSNYKSEYYEFNYGVSEEGESTLTESTVTDAYIVLSKVITYRDTKLYGQISSLRTLHKRNTNTIILLDFALEAFVYQDRLDKIEPANLESDTKQKYHKDRTVLDATYHYKSADYENDLICKYQKDIKKDRGIQATSVANCN